MTNKDIFKGTTYQSLEEQVGGKHYHSMKVDTITIINLKNRKNIHYI